jgi:hypothetical protein
MHVLRILPITCALIVFAAAASAENRNDIAPYRFRTPAEDLNPVERDRAIMYRNDLQRQKFQLDRDEAAGRLDPLERRDKLDTDTELNRMDEVVRGQRSAPMPVPAGRSLPSLPLPVIPRSSP